ncbi:hypothetical protein HMI55_003735, partial [Coelomomyces lativittatus]
MMDCEVRLTLNFYIIQSKKKKKKKDSFRYLHSSISINCLNPMDVEDDLLHLDPITLGIHSLQDEPTEHLREPLPKLDEERLLKPDAFPYLYMSAKKLKFQTTKGKE